MVVTSIERLLRNSSDSCKEIRRLYGYEGNIVFTDYKDQKVKTFNPLSATVESAHLHNFMQSFPCRKFFLFPI